MLGLDRRAILTGCAAAGTVSLLPARARAQTPEVKTRANELPWLQSPDEVSCNFALGHLVNNLTRRVTVEGRVHAETYITAVGAISGYAAQRTLFAQTPPVVGVNINRLGKGPDEQYWFGESLNVMLVPRTNADANRCVWPLALGGAMSAGLQPQQMPKLDEMFRHVARMAANGGDFKSSVPDKHQSRMPARNLLKAVWPLAMTCFSGKVPGVGPNYPAVPVAWWSAIAAQASSRPIVDVKAVLPPDIALTLLMESAIYCSKLDKVKIEGA